MRIGAFEVKEPLPELHEPHAIATLRPWIDVGSAGSLTLGWLEKALHAQDMAKLARPALYFDFTRYRPSMYLQEGEPHVVIPNTVVTSGHGRDHDFVFLHMLEPHMLGDEYTESVITLLQRLGVRRYCLIGSMYDMVPHTRPLLVTGRAAGDAARADLRDAGIEVSNYEGPTTITHLISQQGPRLGIETMTLVVHLPQYTEVEEDYGGQVRLMEVLEHFYQIPLDGASLRRAEEQREQLDAAVSGNPQLKYVLEQLESHYDTNLAQRRREESPKLAPEVEKFLKEMEKRFGQA